MTLLHKSSKVYSHLLYHNFKTWLHVRECSKYNASTTCLLPPNASQNYLPSPTHRSPCCTCAQALPSHWNTLPSHSSGRYSGTLQSSCLNSPKQVAIPGPWFSQHFILFSVQKIYLWNWPSLFLPKQIIIFLWAWLGTTNFYMVPIFNRIFDKY